MKLCFLREESYHFKRNSRLRKVSKGDSLWYIVVRIIGAGILSCPRTHNIYFQNRPTTKFRSAVPYTRAIRPLVLLRKSDKRTNKWFVAIPALITSLCLSFLFLLKSTSLSGRPIVVSKTCVWVVSYYTPFRPFPSLSNTMITNASCRQCKNTQRK